MTNSFLSVEEVKKIIQNETNLQEYLESSLDILYHIEGKVFNKNDLY